MLDALGLTLGDRADSGVVRPGADKADILATFDLVTFPKPASGWPSATWKTTARASCAG
jgi:DNA repair protein RecN (Recombination protein N)